MAHTIWFTGLSASGKSTLANVIREKYKDYIILDGDILRGGLNSDLGFSIEDRNENIRRVIELCKILNRNGINVITAFISPIREMRRKAKKEIENCAIIYLRVSVETCKERDVKGLYAKAMREEIKDFTGIDSPYEEDMEDDYNIYTGYRIEKTKLELFDIVEEIQEGFSEDNKLPVNNGVGNCFNSVRFFKKLLHINRSFSL